MAEIKITIPVAIVTRVLDGLCYQNKYEDNIPDPDDSESTIPNPESKTQFAKRLVREYVKNNVIAYEASRDAETARKSAVISADSDIILS